MTVVTTNHITLDPRGVAYLDGTSTRVTMIVADAMNGLSPDQMHAAYPYLSLAQIHAALAYYYDHQSELDAQIAEEVKRTTALRQQAVASGAQPARGELENRLKGRHIQALHPVCT